MTSDTWKSVAIGHVGDNVREDGGHVVADLYVRDAAAVKAIKAGNIKHISCGYQVDYDPTPGTTPEGERYDGVQRNIRGNHVALLPVGVQPRGGEECVLRLDSNGDEELGRTDAVLKYGQMDEQALKDQIAALNGELAKSRLDAAELPKVRAELNAANAKIAELGEQLKPERLDAHADARAAVVAFAKAEGIDAAGKSTLAVKRAVVAKRTPNLASRVDSMDDAALDAVMVVYGSTPHPSLSSAVSVLGAAAPAAAPADGSVRTDVVDTAKIPKAADLYAKSVAASRDAWKNSGESARKVS